jgi:hypothetical protein
VDVNAQPFRLRILLWLWLIEQSLRQKTEKREELSLAGRRTTKLYDRTSDEITLDEIEQSGI